MATEQVIAESRNDGHENDEVTDATAEKHDEALVVVQRLLKVRGIRATAIHRIGLKLFGDGRPLRKRKRHAPELIAYGDTGWVVAVVTVGQRSGCYMVSLPTVEVTAQMVNADQPHAVVDMVLAAARGGSGAG